MKKFIFALFWICFISLATASNWEDNWIEAIEYKEKKDYVAVLIR